MTAVSAASWFRPIVLDPRARVRVYCLPFAGGTAAAYRPWHAVAPPGLELVAAQLPGRLDRFAEPAVTDQRQLTKQLADVLTAERDPRPYALFGHSMGALLAFEVARELRRRAVREPVLLALSGRAAPQLPDERPQLHPLPDAALVDALAKLGGIPAAVRSEPELLELLLPTLRADVTLCETYRYEPEPPLSCPLAVFGGTDDPMAPTDSLAPWQQQTTGACLVRTYPGHHFYLWDAAPSMLAALAGLLAQA